MFPRTLFQVLCKIESMFEKQSILPQVNVRLKDMILLVATVFSTGQVLLVLKNAAMMMVALTRKYVLMANAKKVVEMIIIANQEKNVTKIHAFLPVNWETPANQLNTAILTIMFASQNVH